MKADADAARSPPAKSEWVKVTDRLPKPGTLVRYRTKTFKYAGHVDSLGRWVDHKGRPEAAEVIEWCDL